MPLTTISLLVHAYVAWRLVPALGNFRLWQVCLSLLIVVSAIALQVGFSFWRRRRVKQTRGHDAAMVAAFVAMGFLSSLLVLTLLRDGVLAGAWIGVQLGLTIPVAH